MSEEADKVVDETSPKPTKESTRFKKGCTPWNKGKKMTNLKTSKDQSNDNTVKIHIIKEKKPLPPREFEGKLEDVKERTAINFINSVVANQPKCINIDGQKYYSSEVMGWLEKKLLNSRIMNKESAEALKKSLEIMNDIGGVASELEKKLEKALFWKNLWRSLTIGCIIGTILLPIANKVFFGKKAEAAKEPPAIVEQDKK